MLKLTYSNLEIQKFSGGGPPDPSSRGGEGSEGRGKGRRERKDREGRGGTGRDREGRREGGEEWGVVGRGTRHGLRPPLPP